MAVTGGKNLRRILRTAGKGGVSSVDVGFYSKSRYQDGTYVAAVAAYNEFGTSRIPSRPFIRNTNEKLRKELPDMIKMIVDSDKMIIDHQTAGLIGVKAVSALQGEIVDLREPENAESTKERKNKKKRTNKFNAKFGETNPLIDTGKMRTSITFKVNY